MIVDNGDHRIVAVDLCTRQKNAVAYRRNKRCIWYIHARDGETFRPVATVCGDQPEARQRELVRAILESLANA